MGQHDVYTENFKPIYRFLYYKNVNKDDIEDLVQDTFVRFFDKYDCSKLSAIDARKILFSIAKNVYREWVREMVNHGSCELFEDDSVCDPEDFIEEVPSEKLEKFSAEAKAAIKQLNPTLRDVLTMRFLQGMSRKEIAEKLKIKEEHVHVYQRRGIKALQKLIGDEFIP